MEAKKAAMDPTLNQLHKQKPLKSARIRYIKAAAKEQWHKSWTLRAQLLSTSAWKKRIPILRVWIWQGNRGTLSTRMSKVQGTKEKNAKRGRRRKNEGRNLAGRSNNDKKYNDVRQRN